MCCRFSGGNRKPDRVWLSEVWKNPARAICSSCPGIARWAFACRLALLPHIPPASFPYSYPADPMIDHAPLPDFHAEVTERRKKIEEEIARLAAEEAAAEAKEAKEKKSRYSARNIKRTHSASFLKGQRDEIERQALIGQGIDPSKSEVRTAIAVEPRDGRLCLFMPPCETLEDYLELLTTAEETAAELGLPIHVEGYSPPEDPRLNVIRVAPDPGVIEVKHPPGTQLGRLCGDDRGDL